jgi:hypothetical protein
MVLRTKLNYKKTDLSFFLSKKAFFEFFTVKLITCLKRYPKTVIKMEMEELAKWAYILFVAIAIVMGLAIGYLAYNAGTWLDPNVENINGWITLIMLILGIIIGLTSITTKEITPFLIATIALVVAATVNVWYPLSKIHELLYYWATGILNYIVAFAAPAAVIISIKAVLGMAKE